MINLPNELVFLVSSHLEVTDLVSLGMTCKMMRDLVSCQEKVKIARDTALLNKTLSECKCLSDRVIKECVSTYKHAESFELEQKDPNRRELLVTESGINEALSKLKNLKSLGIFASCFDGFISVESWKIKSLENLSTLHVRGVYLDIEVLLGLLKQSKKIKHLACSISTEVRDEHLREFEKVGTLQTLCLKAEFSVSEKAFSSLAEKISCCYFLPKASLVEGSFFYAENGKEIEDPALCPQVDL